MRIIRGAGVVLALVLALGLPIATGASAGAATPKAEAAKCRATVLAHGVVTAASGCAYLPEVTEHCPTPPEAAVIKIGSKSYAIRWGSRPIKLSGGYTPSTALGLCGGGKAAPPATTTAKQQKGVTVTLTGAGSASSVTVVDGGNESQHTDEALPYSQALTDHPSFVSITGQAGSGATNTSISCSIASPGHTPVTNQSTGPYTVVNCTTTNF